jgi:hypothetical protein
MEILGHMTGGTGAARKPAFALGLNMSNVITSLASVEEARALPQGTVVGDPHGGLTFSDVIASALEARSLGGWQEIEVAPGDRWTIIVLNR